MSPLCYVCPDCGSAEAVITDTAFCITHEPTCPVFRSRQLAYLADQDVYAAATLVEEARGLVSDYGSAEVTHTPRPLTKSNITLRYAVTVSDNP